MVTEAKVFYNGQTSEYACPSEKAERWEREDGLEVELSDRSIAGDPLVAEYKIKFGNRGGGASGPVINDGKVWDGKADGCCIVGEQAEWSFEIEHKFD